MSFTSFAFVLFFAAVLVLRQFMGNNSRDKWLLLAASIVFYMSWSVPCVVLILFTSWMDFHIGRKIAGTTDPERRRRWLMTSLAGNFGILAFFKYTEFFVANTAALVNALGGHVTTPRLNIILPPAISYFTFASISYVIDVYYERIAPCQSARDYTLFVTFFPKLVAGPIARATDFLPQLEQSRRVSWEDVEAGLGQFLLGAAKKLVVADRLATSINVIFASPASYDRLTLIAGLLGYGAQLYCDFSGYSDMAIGAARLLGFRIPENFQLPFSSVTITEFWRRWHITMSTWFRDYLFLPLEMATRSNPRPLLRMSLNMMATMLLCGLWHGPSWNYVIWGGIHGLALSIHKLWTVNKPTLSWMETPPMRFLGNISSRLLTLGTVFFGFVFFRAATLADALAYLHDLVHSEGGVRFPVLFIPFGVAAVILGHLLINKDRNWALELPQMPVKVRFVAFTGLILALALLAASNESPFIYVKF